jgi:hypothetical protein
MDDRPFRTKPGDRLIDGFSYGSTNLIFCFLEYSIPQPIAQSAAALHADRQLAFQIGRSFRLSERPNTVVASFVAVQPINKVFL